MEHLQIPRTPTHEPLLVPYFCKEEYDGGPFHTYPERKEWSKDELANVRTWDREVPFVFKYVNDVRYNERPKHSLEATEAFLQNWLYFGLLSAFFGLDLA